MTKTLISTIVLILTLCANVNAQGLLQEKNKFTHQDTLRGSITPEREWWDLTYYHLDIQVNPEEKYIVGKNTIQYTVLKPKQILQIDLQEPLTLTKVTQNNKELEIKHDGNAHFVTLKDQQNIGETNSVIAYYEGKPREAIRAPWDGGISWKKDTNGNHFIASSCQGLGASVWWPNKDHMYDEVDSMDISVTIPKGLMNVSNGRLKSIIDNKDETITTNWHVANPINNYGVNINIGNYANFSEVFKGEKGDLDMNYYVLKENLEKAKAHFKDAPKMMKAFEYWFGPYPFYEDSFKLVEVPYLGMEHQSSVTYGNQYMDGYLGDDLSGTGWGLKFDFIIIHESGHEWFANNITNIDIADMWIHESFTSYSENLFLDYYYGKEAAADYVIGKRKNVRNDRPLIGEYNVNNEGSGDMYYKGENMLHTLRQLVNDDEKWRQILRTLNSKFYHQTVTTQQIEDYLADASGLDLKGFFNQYLRSIKIPVLEYKVEGKKLHYKWTNTVDDFVMPIQIESNGQPRWISPTVKNQTLKLKSKNSKIVVDRDFYITVKAL
ncbi:M1 family metallopeptidase [Psychroserpens sp. NJDZ02]|uniref:M1 family metallopeptidase n=1 Tax=Psychroserpens sp. NJDZ02 TaxID=2570561 RepID=UPI0010A8F425|nr:M1 family metallopeptidase [Psychroserpens sp. NJDZ02]QCE42182.1 M1 family metallopeptidase [Psychroserpens sp. NJDZ02]